jgi:hypothetical protein
MSRTGHVRTLRTLALAVALAAANAGCGMGVEVGAEYPDGAYGDYPADGYVATTEPFYYNGFATYWYGGRWNYRDGSGRWNHYDREPAALAQHRMQGGARRRNYEPSGGRPAGRSSGGRSGGRSGGHR